MANRVPPPSPPSLVISLARSRALQRAIILGKSSTSALSTVIGYIVGQVTRAPNRRDSEPVDFNFFFEALSRQFDHGVSPLPGVSARPTRRIITRLRVNLAPSTPVTDASPAVRHPLRVGRQHCQRKIPIFRKIFVSHACSAPSTGKPRQLPLRTERFPLVPATFIGFQIQHPLLPRRAFMLFRRRTPPKTPRHWRLACSIDTKNHGRRGV